MGFSSLLVFISNRRANSVLFFQRKYFLQQHSVALFAEDVRDIIPENTVGRLTVKALLVGLTSVLAISMVQALDSQAKPIKKEHLINSLWKSQWKWGTGLVVTGCYPRCFPFTIWFWADQEKYRMRLYSDSIIHSNCLYLKTSKNCNVLINLVTFCHAFAHSLTMMPFSFTEKLVTTFFFFFLFLLGCLAAWRRKGSKMGVGGVDFGEN